MNTKIMSLFIAFLLLLSVGSVTALEVRDSLVPKVSGERGDYAGLPVLESVEPTTKATAQQNLSSEEERLLNLGISPKLLDLLRGRVNITLPEETLEQAFARLNAEVERLDQLVSAADAKDLIEEDKGIQQALESTKLLRSLIDPLENVIDEAEELADKASDRKEKTLELAFRGLRAEAVDLLENIEEDIKELKVYVEANSGITLSVSPESQTVKRGEIATYQLIVKNKASENVMYTIITSPVAWGTVSNSIADGLRGDETKTYSISVAVKADAALGTHDLKVNVINFFDGKNLEVASFKAEVVAADGTPGDSTGDNSSDNTPKTEFQLLDEKVDALETELSQIDDDVDEADDDLQNAKRRDRTRDINEAEEDLEDAEEELEDLREEVEDLEDEVREAQDDNKISRSQEDDLLERIDDLLQDIDNLQDDIDDALGRERDSARDEYLNTLSNTPAVTSQPPRQQTQPTEVVIEPLNLPVTGNAVTEQSASNWNNVRVIALVAAGVVILLAVIVFLVALMVSRR